MRSPPGSAARSTDASTVSPGGQTTRRGTFSPRRGSAPPPHVPGRTAWPRGLSSTVPPPPRPAARPGSGSRSSDWPTSPASSAIPRPYAMPGVGSPASWRRSYGPPARPRHPPIARSRRQPAPRARTWIQRHDDCGWSRRVPAMPRRARPSRRDSPRGCAIGRRTQLRGGDPGGPAHSEAGQALSRQGGCRKQGQWRPPPGQYAPGLFDGVQ